MGGRVQGARVSGAAPGRAGDRRGGISLITVTVGACMLHQSPPLLQPASKPPLLLLQHANPACCCRCCRCLQANTPAASRCRTVDEPNRPLQSVTVLLFQKLLSTSGTFTSPVSSTDRGPMGGGAGARGGGGGPRINSPLMPSAPPAWLPACAARTAAAVCWSMPATMLRPGRRG
jgi:hypothetical protein